MPKPRRVLAALVLAAALLLSLVAAVAVASSAKVMAPVIHETFTPLPCSGSPAGRTTRQQLGCAERDILRSDHQIDAVARTVFARLSDGASRRRFVTASRVWLSYRNADCASLADVFLGGSEAPVLAARCEVARNGTRLFDLRTFARDLNR